MNLKLIFDKARLSLDKMSEFVELTKEENITDEKVVTFFEENMKEKISNDEYEFAVDAVKRKYVQEVTTEVTTEVDEEGELEEGQISNKLKKMSTSISDDLLKMSDFLGNRNKRGDKSVPDVSKDIKDFVAKVVNKINKYANNLDENNDEINSIDADNNQQEENDMGKKRADEVRLHEDYIKALDDFREGEADVDLMLTCENYRLGFSDAKAEKEEEDSKPVTNEQFNAMCSKMDTILEMLSEAKKGKKEEEEESDDEEDDEDESEEEKKKKKMAKLRKKKKGGDDKEDDEKEVKEESVEDDIISTLKEETADELRSIIEEGDIEKAIEYANEKILDSEENDKYDDVVNYIVNSINKNIDETVEEDEEEIELSEDVVDHITVSLEGLTESNVIRAEKLIEAVEYETEEDLKESITTIVSELKEDKEDNKENVKEEAKKKLDNFLIG